MWHHASYKNIVEVKCSLKLQEDNSLTFFFFFFFGLFRATTMAYGGSQVRSVIGAVTPRPTPEPQQCRIWAMSATHTTVHSNARSLTHWSRPGIKPETSWCLVRFVSDVPQQELLEIYFLNRFQQIRLIYLHPPHTSSSI